MGKKLSNLLKTNTYLQKAHAYCVNNRSFCLLFLFFIAVLVIGYIIPSLLFGRPFGTDTYTHIFHAQEMFATDSLFDFYEELGKKVLNPDLANNLFNYPFGSWLFIAVFAKVSHMGADSAAYIFSIVFLGITALTYYIYSGLFLETKYQKLFAVLFLFSMPNIVISVNNFRPSTFIIPFLLLALYSAYPEKLTIRNLILMSLAVFAIAISHTGSLIYIMIFSIGFFWIYCFAGRKFSNSLFILASSTFLFFWIAVKLFPHLYEQYASKSSLFLTPGTFLSGKFHIFFADELFESLYQNLFVNHEFVFVLIWSAFIFTIGHFLVLFGKHSYNYFSFIWKEKNYAIIPLGGISHSFLTTPLWIGPIHAILGIIGFFRLDLKGKCFAVTAFLTTVAPAIMQASEGFVGATGALREISYLLIIVPVVAVLGLFRIIPVIQNTVKNAKIATTVLLIFIFSMTIVTPVIGNMYYLPLISGEDYIIEGMDWLSVTGHPDEKVVGYGYRTVPVYTDKRDATYGLASGKQTRTFVGLLNDLYFEEKEDSVMDIYSLFGAKYILISEKLIDNLNSEKEELSIDSHLYLDKIFSSKDFGVYGFIQQSTDNGDSLGMSDQVLMSSVGSNIEVRTKTYKVVLDQKVPKLKYVGSPSKNLLEEGLMHEVTRISWLGNSDDIEAYRFVDQVFTREQKGNQIAYHTVLKDGQGLNNWSSVTVLYTFQPEVIKREFIISNDMLSGSDTPVMMTYFSTNLLMPASSFMMKRGLKKAEKDIYPSDDSVDINDVYGEFFFSNGDSGIYLQYDDTSPNPQYISYKGSTIYDYCSFSIGNYEMIQPGASLHVTQYISVGDKYLAKQHIDNGNRISLHPYPNGIIPLVFCGYDSGGSSTRYGKVDAFTVGNVSIEYTDVTGVMRLKSTLNSVYNDMEREIPYTIGVSVRPPYENLLYCEGLRHPQIAEYNGKPTGTVILPESEPQTRMLSTYYSREEFFSYWEDVIRSVSSHDDMALFLLRPEEVENPEFSHDFLDIISFAKESGLTITDPETISSHYKNLQYVSYNASFEMDEAVITVINQNDFPVEGVTFKVRMPFLDKGKYVVDNGIIERSARFFTDYYVYVSVDLDRYEEKTLFIRPGFAKKKLSVEIPDSPKEGEIKIVVRDDEGNSVKNALISIDDQPYMTNEYGNISLNIRRGSHEVTVEKAGYLKETQIIDVKSYFSEIEGMVESVLG